MGRNEGFWARFILPRDIAFVWWMDAGCMIIKASYRIQGDRVPVTEAAGDMPPMIVVEGLRKSIRTGTRTVEILKGIDFNIPRGEFAAIMGASGSGKSTLLGLLAGLDSPSEGNVLLNGTAISYLAEDKLAQVRGKTIGFVFQSYQLIPTLTALENVLLPYELNDESGDRKAGLDRARELLVSVGLEDRLDHYPVQLSGGEQQRVALARAFILRPPIVLADEPTGNLDTTNGQAVLDLLLSLNHAEGTTLVLVTHDPALAAHATRVLTMRDGLLVGDVQQAPSVAHL
jgi:putative ABC transport system ATP-binding protein